MIRLTHFFYVCVKKKKGINNETRIKSRQAQFLHSKLYHLSFAKINIFIRNFSKQRERERENISGRIYSKNVKEKFEKREKWSLVKCSTLLRPLRRELRQRTPWRWRHLPSSSCPKHRRR